RACKFLNIEKVQSGSALAFARREVVEKISECGHCKLAFISRRRRYSERFERRVHDVAQYLRAPHAVDGRRYTAFDLPISRIALIERNELAVSYGQARRRLEIPFRKSIDRFIDTRVGSHCCKRRGSVGTLRVRESPQDERKQYLGVAHLYAALEMARIQY